MGKNVAYNNCLPNEVRLKTIVGWKLDITQLTKNHQRDRRKRRREKILCSLSKISKLVLLIQAFIFLNYANGIFALFISHQKQSASFSSSSTSRSDENVQVVSEETQTELTAKYNWHDSSLANRTIKNFCYCSYGSGVCDFNKICIKHDMAACFHAMKQVYVSDSNEGYNDDNIRFNKKTGFMQTQHFYGCAPLERGSNASHLTCNGWRSTHSAPLTIACCYEGNFCNMNITPNNFAVSDRVKDTTKDIVEFNTRSLSNLILLVVGSIFVALLMAILIYFQVCHKKQKIPYWIKCETDKFEAKKSSLTTRNECLPKIFDPTQNLLAKPDFDLVDFDTTGSGSGLGGVTLNQRTIALDLTMLEIVARGRYGEVRKAIYRGSVVAVKTFYTTEEESWKNERDIYQTQMLNHENILQYIAADICSNVESITQMMLITDYHALGSLYDYLRERRCCCTHKKKGHTAQASNSSSSHYFTLLSNSEQQQEISSTSSSTSCSCCLLSLSEALQLAYSTITGIEHLHSAMRGTGSRRKPEIVHRDIKSKNVIVKRPGVCCIADFGLALRLENNVILPENISVQVGTKRYMAPELLARTLNLSNFDEFKAADIYSFSLVLWEIIQMVQFNEKRTILQRDPAKNHQRRVISCSSSSGIATGGSDRSTSFLIQSFQPLQNPAQNEIKIKPQAMADLLNNNLNSFNDNAVNDASRSCNKNAYDVQCIQSIEKNDDNELDNKTTNLISRSVSSVAFSTPTSGTRTYLLPYQNFVENDPSFEEMRQIVCDANMRPTLEPEWCMVSNPIIPRLCELMCECWSQNATSRHTSLKVKIEIANLISTIYEF